MADNLEARVMKAMQAITPPKTTQDNVDKLTAELATATLVRQHADARYDRAKKGVIDTFPDRIDKIKTHASEAMTKSTVYIDGAEWRIEAIAATPQTRVNVDELRTELVKSGVKIDLIDKCIKKVEKKSQPALTLKCHANAGASAK